VSENWTIEGIFKGRAEAFVLFKHVYKFIESLGPVKTGITKTQISFSTRTGFAWVWLPQMWIKKASENAIVLSFGLGRRIEHPHVKESNEPYPGRWMHHVVIEKQSEFDDDVREWLKEAYKFSQAKANRQD
jgi:hypothetical protein